MTASKEKKTPSFSLLSEIMRMLKLLQDERTLVELLTQTMLVLALLTIAAFILFRPHSGKLFPYGRFLSTTNKFTVPARIGWFLMALPSLLLPLVAIWQVGGIRRIPYVNNIALLMFLFHYSIRTLIFPLLIRNGKPYPLHLLLMGIILLTWNGFIQGFSLAKYAELPVEKHLGDPLHLIGIPLFLAGLYINFSSDYRLAMLRLPGESDYKIPRGGFFELVSCANYFGELLLWTGFWLFVRTDQALAILLITISNLVPRALDTHSWYKERFGKAYPVNRKAIIPYLL